MLNRSMETLVEVGPSSKSWNLRSGGTPESRRSGRPPSSYSSVHSQRMNPMRGLDGSAADQKRSGKAARGDPHLEEELSTVKNLYVSDKAIFVASGEVKDKSALRETATSVTHPVSGSESSSSSEGDMKKLTDHVTTQSRQNFCPSPSNSVYTNTGTLYVEAKQSFTNTEVSEEASTISNSYDVESQKASIYKRSTDSNVSNVLTRQMMQDGKRFKVFGLERAHWNLKNSTRC